ncbi:MAG: hypothetical protein ACRYFU_21400 [Janthinobacterium lividum]
MNHPLPQFSSSTQLRLPFNVDYGSKAVSLNTAPVSGGGVSPTFGFMDSKTAAPYARIIELNVKCNF